MNTSTVRYIKKIKAKMLGDHCEEVEIGWYKSNDVIGHTGVVVSLKGNKVFVINFDVVAEDSFIRELSSVTEKKK